MLADESLQIKTKQIYYINKLLKGFGNLHFVYEFTVLKKRYTIARAVGNK